MSLHESMNVEDHAALVSTFFAEAKHPTLGRPYQTCTYAPMVELLRYLEGNGFTCYIVSGGGRDFMRPITSAIYGIPPERVVGSSQGLKIRGRGRPRRPADPARARRLRRRPREAGADLEPHRPAADPGGGQLQRRRRDADVLGQAATSRRCGCWCCTTTPSANSTTPQAPNARWTMPSQYGWTVVSMKNDWTTVFSD